MAYSRTEYPQWSWSSSRKSTFEECKRRYYYNYYLSHNGWEDAASPESRQAYRLKKITGLHLILGSAVHEAAEYVCSKISESNELPPESELRDMVRDILNSAWKESKNKELWLNNPNKYTMLLEFYYFGRPSDSTVEKIKNKLDLSVPNIIRSKSIQEILSGKCKVVFTENMDTFDIFETPVYAIPDLVYETSTGEWIVVDWKTGSPSGDHDKQIAVYAMYLNRKMEVPIEKINGMIEYLLQGESRKVEINTALIEDTMKAVETSISDMKSYLEDQKLNKPKEKNEFPLRDINDRNLCRWCNFYEMCEEELGD